MAQVLWQEISSGLWTSCSAGSKPSGYVHPLALKAIEELGFNSEGLTSKSIGDIDLTSVDLAVTVCDNAKNDCPVLPEMIETLHWPFDDPADAEGSDEEKMIVFRRVRDEIRQRITEYLGENNE